MMNQTVQQLEEVGIYLNNKGEFAGLNANTYAHYISMNYPLIYNKGKFYKYTSGVYKELDDERV